MSVQAASDTRCGIGTRLRAGRERKGLTVLQAAERLHVDPKILESLESEDFNALGASVYVRGHLRHYAELVGETPAELLAIYTSSIAVTPPDLTRIPKAQPPSDLRRLTVPASVLLSAFAIAGLVWWLVTLPKGHPHASAARTAAAANPPVVPSAEPSAAATAGPSATPAPVARASPLASAAAPVPPAGGIQSEPAAPPAAARPGREAQLTLRFAAESWAEVYDSGGQRLFYDVGAAASVRTFKGTPPLRVVLGNASGVAVEVNGRVAGLAGLTHADGSAQFVISRAGRLSRPAH